MHRHNQLDFVYHQSTYHQTILVDGVVQDISPSSSVTQELEVVRRPGFWSLVFQAKQQQLVATSLTQMNELTYYR